VGQATPFQVGFFRFLLASSIYLIILLVTEKKKIFHKYSLGDFGKFFLLGALGVFGYGVIFLIAMQFTTASQGSVIAGINPSLLAIFAFFFFKEQLTPKWRYFGLLFSFFGAFLIIGVQAFIKFDVQNLIGNLLVVVAMFFWVSYSLYGKKVMQKFTSLELTTWSSLFGMVLFGLGAVFENQWALVPTLPIDFWIGILVLGLGTTVIGFFGYFYAIKHIGAVRSGVFINLVPVFGTLSSIILIPDDPIPWTLWIGLVLISLGIFFINYPRRTKKTANDQEEIAM
jgi:drug/metabolite transporter (DMT)-like permease